MGIGGRCNPGSHPEGGEYLTVILGFSFSELKYLLLDFFFL
jgi:hypothetical protein